MRPHTLCPLRIGHKPNTIETGISGRALIQENLRSALGVVSGERSPVGQISRALNGVAQACGSGVAELEAGGGESLCITESDRRRSNDVNANRVRGGSSTRVLASNITNVSIGDFFFSPAAVTINVNDQVKWTWIGSVGHTTTSNTGLWDSGVKGNGSTFVTTFATAGTFPYH